MDVAPRVLGVGRSNGTWESQKNILEVDSDGFWGHPGPLTLAHLLRTFFLIKLSTLNDMRTRLVRLPI